MTISEKKETSIDEHCQELANFLRSIAPLEEFFQLLRVILTPAEIEAISQRLSILDFLAVGKPQREIAEVLEVGIATVTRGSRAWQDLRPILERHFPRK